MIHYFPLQSDRYEMPMNARAESGALIEVEADRYRDEIAQKERIIASDPRYYVQCPPEVEALAWEAIAHLLPDMAAHLPQHFALEMRGDHWTWTNRLFGTVTTFTPGDTGSLPLPPLDWIGLQVQEDLILMAEREDGDTVCVAGHLCFGSVWCLDDKLGKSFLQVHDPVPEFRERIGTPSDQLMRRLKPERPVSRLNWTLAATPQLNLAPAVAAEWRATAYGITPDNVAARVFFRVERQTLTRMPHTRGILFTIHTYINPLGEVVAEPDRLRRLTSVMRDYPDAMKDYKSMRPYFDLTLAYLEDQCQQISFAAEL
jgi:dimethylamine monooxygenase subunit A